MTSTDSSRAAVGTRPVPLALTVLQSALGAGAAAIALGDLPLGTPLRLVLVVALALGSIGLDARIRAAFAGIPPARSVPRIAVLLAITAAVAAFAILAPPRASGIELAAVGLGAWVLLLGLLRQDHQRLRDPRRR